MEKMIKKPYGILYINTIINQLGTFKSYAYKCPNCGNKEEIEDFMYKEILRLKKLPKDCSECLDYEDNEDFEEYY